MLPLVDIDRADNVPDSIDVLDPEVWAHLMEFARQGMVRFAHFGTPCTTFSAARKHRDGGPPPIRSSQHLYGIPNISKKDQAQVDVGTQFLLLTLEMASIPLDQGNPISIENPLTSLM